MFTFCELTVKAVRFLFALEADDCQEVGIASPLRDWAHQIYVAASRNGGRLISSPAFLMPTRSTMEGLMRFREAKSPLLWLWLIVESSRNVYFDATAKQSPLLCG
eukprot:scaffold21607_cov61-Cyclotella_meneghiniana.AAC.3